MQLWQGRFESPLDAQVNDFNASIRIDKRMVQEDIGGSIAHATMLGACALKCVKFFSEGNVLTREELWMLAAGMLASFLTSLTAIRFLLNFVKRHSFFGFGIYRIALGAVVILMLV